MTASVNRSNQSFSLEGGIPTPCKRKRTQVRTHSVKKTKHFPFRGLIPRYLKNHDPYYFSKCEEVIQVLEEVVIFRRLDPHLLEDLAAKVKTIMLGPGTREDRMAELGALLALMDTDASTSDIIESQLSCFDTFQNNLCELLSGYKKQEQDGNLHFCRKQFPTLYRYTVLKKFASILFLKEGWFNPCGVSFITKMLKAESSVALYIKEDHYDHLLKVLSGLSSLKSVTAKKAEILSDMEPFVRSIVMKPKDQPLTRVDLSRAVLISLMSRYSQGEHGICYAIAPVIDVIQNDPSKMYEWLLNLYTVGIFRINTIDEIALAPFIQMHCVDEGFDFLFWHARFGDYPFIRKILDICGIERPKDNALLQTTLSSKEAKDFFFHHLSNIATLPLTLVGIIAGLNSREPASFAPPAINTTISAITSCFSGIEKMNETTLSQLEQQLQQNLLFVDMIYPEPPEPFRGRIMIWHGELKGEYSSAQPLEKIQQLRRVLSAPRLLFVRQGKRLQLCKTLTDLAGVIEKLVPSLHLIDKADVLKKLAKALLSSMEELPDSWVSFMHQHDLCFMPSNGGSSYLTAMYFSPLRENKKKDESQCTLDWIEKLSRENQVKQESRFTFLSAMNGHAYTLEPDALIDLKSRYSYAKQQLEKTLNKTRSLRAVGDFFKSVDGCQYDAWMKQFKKSKKPICLKEAAKTITDSQGGVSLSTLHEKVLKEVSQCRLSLRMIESVLTDVYPHALTKKYQEIARIMKRSFPEAEYPHVIGHKLRKLMLHFKLPAVPSRVLAEKIATYCKKVPFLYIGDSNWVIRRSRMHVALSYDCIKEEPMAVKFHKRGIKCLKRGLFANEDVRVLT